ncbi:MAG: ABC transporter permease, partial [Bdellovibrionales bacterium]|nr:ABC transporter permease [Bdellovibrionales bacterium]
VITVLTVSVVLFILGMFLMVLTNVESMLASTKDSLSVSLYLEDDLIDTQLNELIRKVRERPEVSSVEFWSKSRALIEFRESLGEEASVLDGLDMANPLPASIEIQFHKEELTGVRYENFINSFKDYAGVAHVQYNSTFLDQLSDVLFFVRIAGIFMVLLLCLICAFVIGSTIRLALYHRRNDLAIMRLVGASRMAISLPCFTEGVLQGFLGSIGGILLLRFSFDLLKQALASTIVSDFLGHEVLFLGFGSGLLVVLVGTSIGGAGAYFAVRKIQEI